MAEAEYAPEGNTSSATLVPGTSDTSSFRKRKAAEMEAASIEAGGTIGQGTDEAAPAPIKAPRADSAAASDEGAVEGTEGSTTVPQPFRVETVEKGDEDPAQPFQPQTDTASSVTPISHWGNDPTTPGHADMQNESDDSIERVVRDRQTEQSVHPDFTHGDFCLISNDDIAFHVESYHLRSASVIFRSMFAASTGEARTHLTGANEAAADLAPFLKLVTGDMTPLQDHRLEPFKSLYSLVDKYECPSLRALLRSQMVLLNSCSQNSRIGIFLLAASDGNWPACAEALRTAQLGGKWANGGIPPRCVACCGKCKTPTGGIGLTSPDLKQTLLDPASLCVEHFAALTRYPAVLFALLRAIEFSKSRYTKVSHSAVSAMFLHLMMEHEKTSVGKTTRTRPTNDFYDHPLPACDEACNDHDETITL